MKKRLIKALICVILLFLIFTLIACDGKSTDENENQGNTEPQVISIDGGTIDGVNIYLEVEPSTNTLNLSDMLKVSQNASWQLFDSNDGQNLIPTKFTYSLKDGENLYYVVVSSENNANSKTYTLNIWRNFYGEIIFKANDVELDRVSVLSHTTVTLDPPSEMLGYDLTWDENFYYVTEKCKIFTASSVMPKQYTITLDANGGMHSSNSNNIFSVAVTYNEKYNLPVPTKTGYVFVGWYYNTTFITDEEGVDLTYEYTQDVTYIAQWIPQKYNIEVKSNDEEKGVVDDVTGKYDYGSNVTVTATPNNGYSFVGWCNYYDITTYVSTEATYTLTTPSHDLKLIAIFTSYHVTTNTNLLGAGTYTNYSDTAISIGEQVTLVANTNAGYIWLGWYENETKVSNGIQLDYTFLMTSENRTYTAKWEICYHENVENCSCTICKYPVHEIENCMCSNCGKNIHNDNEACIHDEYVYFGSYPQSLKSNAVTITNITNNKGHYLGSDNEWYAKVVANPYATNYTFSDGRQIMAETTYYFKIETLKWRMLNKENGKVLLVSNSIIDARMYSENADNVKYCESTIRMWLNNDFYNTAFSELQKDLILSEYVDNSAASTGIGSNNYACDDTFDDIFLLSYSEVVNENYGFSTSYVDNDEARQILTSDYSRAMGVYMSVNSAYYGMGTWWLRSPYGAKKTRIVNYDGKVNSDKFVTLYQGVVPALCIQLEDKEEPTNSSMPVYTLEMNTNNSINAEDAIYVYTAMEKGILSINVSNAIMGNVEISYSVNGGESETLKINSSTQLVLKPNDVVTIPYEQKGIVVFLRCGRQAVKKKPVAWWAYI